MLTQLLRVGPPIITEVRVVSGQSKGVDASVKEVARRAVHRAVRRGQIPHPALVPCMDCSHIGPKRRHEYDHHLGYEPEHVLHVQVVCTVCHVRRTFARGERIPSKALRDTSVPTQQEMERACRFQNIPFPAGAMFMLSAVKSLFGVSMRTLYNELSEGRARFDKPMYRRGGDRRLRRILSEHDVDVLRDIFRVRVKP